ncbi:pyridoxamine 5'-phosphate oxidase family protein [Mycobacterium sp. NPDC048908]|uniref:pyridoxamine 5'-phosphate oxidase family protein n=1 Tax=Mycobacterium sp. NPDC048908 TaxID=3364292 RepID=UPI00371B128A
MAGRGSDWGAGMLAIDLQGRMRARINGALRADEDGMTLAVEECYANCPKFIHSRDFTVDNASSRVIVTQSDRLSAEGRALVRNTDTMFIASIGPDGSADVSHRGGPPGFVESSADGTTLRFPDYPGNGVFNTLGNLHSDGRAGLTVLGFESGVLLQLTGQASPRQTTAPASTPVRIVEFAVTHAVSTENAGFVSKTTAVHAYGDPAPAGAG